MIFYKLKLDNKKADKKRGNLVCSYLLVLIGGVKNKLNKLYHFSTQWL
jgi:hypothetical protein